MSPLVSVLMATRNNARFLPDAVESVLGQSFRDLELVIGDNASDDETPAIVARYRQRDDRIVYFRNAENLGATANFNRCYRRADPTSKYFVFFPSDDLWEPHFLERLVTVAESHPEVTVVHADAYRTDPTGRIIGKHSDLYRRLPPPGEHRCVRELYEGCYILAPAALVNRVMQRWIYPVEDIFHPGLAWSPDFDLWLQLMTRGAKAYYVPEPLAYHRRHEGAMAMPRNLVGMLRDAVTIFDQRLEGVCPPELEPARQEALRARLAALGSELLLAGQLEAGRLALDRARRIPARPPRPDLAVAWAIASLPLPSALRRQVWQLAVAAKRALLGVGRGAALVHRTP